MKAQFSEPDKLVLRNPQRVSALYFEETPLHFANGTTDIDQKRGLSLHGPSDKSSLGPQTIRLGIVSSSEGIQDVTSWVRRFNEEPIESSGVRPFLDQTFPGLIRAFDCRLVTSDSYNEVLLTREIQEVVSEVNPNLRIRKAADLYSSKVRTIARKVSRPDVIICHEPADIEEKCGAGMTLSEKRKGALTKEEKELADGIRKNVESHYFLLAPLDDDTQNLLEMRIDQDFRALLKAKCLDHDIPIQILTETVLSRLVSVDHPNLITKAGQDPSTIAWNIAAAIYYKANHSPWKVGNLRQGTCYIGISFYHDKTTTERDMRASLAQVFTETGEGMVVRGNSFQWDAKSKGEPRLSEDSASELLADSITVYKQHHNNQAPNRIVIHKSSRYSREELDGFLKTGSEVPIIDLVALGESREQFFYRNGDNPILRGTCVPLGRGSYLIYTKGYIPYQRGYHKPRVPRALEITEHYGDTSLDELAKEVLALTRLNWNTTDYCIYWPVTLEFATKVGEILGRVPEGAPIKENYYYYM